MNRALWMAVQSASRGASAPAGPADPNYSTVVLLLHGDGTNGGTTITDNGPSARTPTAAPGVTTSTLQYQFGTGALYFSGSSSRVQYDSVDLAPGATSDFCVEMFLKLSSVTASAVRIICTKGTSSGYSSFQLSLTTAGNLRAVCHNASASGIEADILAPSPLSTNFNHIAFSRRGINFRLFINGALVGSTTSANPVYTNAGDPLVIGNTSDALYPAAPIFIEEFRYSKHFRYDAAFTPPTAPLPDHA